MSKTKINRHHNKGQICKKIKPTGLYLNAFTPPFFLSYKQGENIWAAFSGFPYFS